MRIVVTADLHGHLPEIPECDLLLIAGDVTPAIDHNSERQRLWMKREFKDWLLDAPAQVIVGIAGNHDFIAQDDPYVMYDLPWVYLCDESVEVMGVKIHGSPWTPTFYNWAFMKDDPALKKHWQLIPTDTEILLTHGPPRGIRDMTARGVAAGSMTLRRHLESLPRLRLHAFGHIHEDPGIWNCGRVSYVNATLVNLAYDAVNHPVVVDLAEPVAA